MIRIEGVEYDVIELPQLNNVESEPVYQRLKALGKELAFPYIHRVRELRRAGWDLAVERRPDGLPAVITDRHRELVLVYRPVVPGELDTMASSLSADEVRADALKMLRALYEATAADVGKGMNNRELGILAGLREMDEIEHVLRYLASRNLVVKEHDTTRLTDLGIQKIEAALEHPSEPAAPYLPPINMITAHTINIAAGAQLMQGGDHLQQSAHTTLTIPELKAALGKIEALAHDFEETNRRQIGGLVTLLRSEADRSAPSHGRIRALLSSLKTVAETFVGGAAANLATAPAEAATVPAIIELAHHLLQHLPT